MLPLECGADSGAGQGRLKLRILHVVPYMHPRAGGPPVVVEKLVRLASGLGHESEIISTPRYCNGDEAELLARLNEIAPTTFLASSAGSYWEARREISDRVKSSDIVHVHTLWNPINILVRRACSHHGRPYVLMPHGMLDPYSLNQKPLRKKIYLAVFERKNVMACSRLVYTTAEEESLAQARNPWLPRGIVVPLGGDGPSIDFERAADAFLGRFPVARGRRQVLFLGRLDFKKGLDRLVAAFPAVLEAYPDALLTIVGDGTPDFVGALSQQISEWNLQDHVLMTGGLAGTVKWGAYACAELFVLPSRQENYAITVAEAMHMAVPVVIGSKVNSWPHVQAAGAGIVVDEEDMKVGLTSSLISLLRDRDMAKKMGVRGQSYARQYLTWQKFVESVLQCYAEIIGSNGLGART
jgi:glycosyltransferase involved in cell wall biosynthesis